MRKVYVTYTVNLLLELEDGIQASDAMQHVDVDLNQAAARQNDFRIDVLETDWDWTYLPKKG